MAKETESVAITNWDESNPIQVTVVETTEPLINAVVGLNPDWTLLWE